MTRHLTISKIADEWLCSPRYAGTAERTILAMKLAAMETQAMLDDALTVIGHDADFVRAEAEKIRAGND